MGLERNLAAKRVPCNSGKIAQLEVADSSGPWNQSGFREDAKKGGLRKILNRKIGEFGKRGLELSPIFPAFLFRPAWSSPWVATPIGGSIFAPFARF
jgi:hypothetical protein